MAEFHGNHDRPLAVPGAGLPRAKDHLNLGTLSRSSNFGVFKRQDFSAWQRIQSAIIKERKRPHNNTVAALVFGDKSTKELSISKAIDYYNRNHSLVDVANQLCGNFTCQEKASLAATCPTVRHR